VKRKAIIIFTLVALLSMLFSVSTASAATRRIGLLTATVLEGQGGAEFSFRVWGEFDEFTGFVRHHGNVYDLHCSLDESDSRFLYCRMVGPSMGGQTVQVVVNGFSYMTYVESVGYCYPVFDWPYPDTSGPWVNYGDHCTKYQPNEGDTYLLNGYWPGNLQDYFNYEYLLDGGFCGPDGSWNDYGQGFYFQNCAAVQ
jgi:hypothetical protein